MYMTLAVKNLFGCVAGKRKIEWHFKAERYYEHFARVLVEVAKAVSPALTIVDGVLAMEGNGPNAGTPRQLGVIVAGTDCVAVDAVICEMLSIDPDLLYTHRVAREIGWGVGELREIELRGVPLEEVRVKDWQPARAVDVLMRIPGFLRRWLRRLFTSRPKVDRKICKVCGVCGSVCPVKAITTDKKLRINYDKCICCFCCQEICPYGAIGVKDGLFVRLLRKRR
jgi:ferredoxin